MIEETTKRIEIARHNSMTAEAMGRYKRSMKALILLTVVAVVSALITLALFLSERRHRNESQLNYAHPSKDLLVSSPVDVPPVSIRSVERSAGLAHTSYRRMKAPSLPYQVAGSVEERLQDHLMYEVTAYSHGCTLPRGGRERAPQKGADGRWPVSNVTVAADADLHPFGTEVLIEGLGFRTVGDRGRAIKGHRLDLFVSTCREARSFGRRLLRVHTVPPGTTRLAEAEGQ